MNISKISKKEKEAIVSTLKRKKQFYINTISPIFSFENSKGEIMYSKF